MKTFLSIGTGPGMGIATARRFAREGFRVVLAARNGARLEELAASIPGAGQNGRKVAVHEVDAADGVAIARLVEAVATGPDGLQVLHYNAAAIRRASLAEQPRETFVSDLAVNIGGALAAIQAATPHLAAPGAESGPASLLLTGGGFALHPHPDYLSLSIGKAGLRALALGLFENYRDRDIHVATVTVAGFTGPGDPERVADLFWELHTQPKDA